MKFLRPVRFGFFLCVLLCPGLIAQAQNSYEIGQTLLQATTTNLNGAGIVIGQVEANLTGNSLSSFEVNPAMAKQPASLFSYLSYIGTATGFTNTVGLESWHGDDVACAYYGLPNGLATNVAHVYNYDASFFIALHIISQTAANNESVINQSFAYDPPLDVETQMQADTCWDNFEEKSHTLFVTAAGNASVVEAPGTAYNLISVGSYNTPASSSGIGPTIDNGRCKPDITAIGNATSFTTPQVSGAATLLMQAAFRGDGGADTNSAVNPRTIKALLLNGAVKPLGWTNCPAFPLDARYGAGVVNVFNSYQLLTGGKNPCLASNLVTSGSPHPPLAVTASEPVLNGWDFNTITSSSNPPCDSICHYYFNVTNNTPATSFAGAATLVWNRQMNQSAINNLDLFLYNCANSNLVACSTSLVNNVEHLWLTNLPQGCYDLQVWKAGNTNMISPAEPYALAWQFYSENLTVNPSGTNTALTWPLYPAGFLVQATTPGASSWTNLDLSTLVFTNNQNHVTLNPTDPAHFFRLRSPNL